MPISESLRALLSNIIDYAGLFPPAKLDMRSTVENYARYLQSEDAWMLGRLIVPVSRLDEFEQHAGELLPHDGSGDPWQISALTAAAGTPELQADFERIDAFNATHEAAGTASIDMIELIATSENEIEQTVEAMPPGLFAFFELSIERNPADLINAISSVDSGAKVRTGGMTADKFPSSAALARFIFNCASLSVPFKATAGMHHPLRHHVPDSDIREHGFLNVFMAGCLGLTNELPEQELIELLDDDAVRSFEFSNDFAGWRGHRIRTENIEDVRKEFAMSFGSCSFDEPREHLRSLGLM